MITPLPGGKADELLWHLQQCMVCTWAKLAPIPSQVRCGIGQRLIRQTLEERHGKR